MFRENQEHLQPGLLSTVNSLPEKVRERLEQSWAGTFYRECFCRIDESVFAVLYSGTPSRPNIPVNVLVGLEVLKSGFGWSDNELYDSFLYDVQVRYAVGYDQLGDGHFELRTLYNFRRRLSAYNQEHDVNLMAKAFAAITDGQVQGFQVRTQTLRMDTTQIASDILDASRLHLVVEGIKRLYRLLDKEAQRPYAALCAPYIQQEAEHYVYGIKGKVATQTALEAAGPVLAQMLDEMAAAYGDKPVYQTVAQLFADNYHRVSSAVTPKGNAEIESSALQSLDDTEATFRRKHRKAYKGYVANVTETCDEENDLQLVIEVQIAPNNTDDSQLLVDAVPSLQERTQVETLYTDGGFGSPAGDEVLNDAQIRQIQTGLRGKAPDPTKFALADFAIEQDDQGHPTHLTCPQGQRVAVVPGRTTGYLVHFDSAVCQDCPFHHNGRCRAQPQKRNPTFTLSFTLQEVFWALRRQRYRDLQKNPTNPRAAVEATVRSLKHPWPNSKLPVRGRFRVSCLLLASALMCNVRRIHRYLTHYHPPTDSDRLIAPLAWLLLYCLFCNACGYLGRLSHLCL